MSYGCSSFGSHRPMRRYLEGCGRKAKWGGKCPRKEGRRVSVCLPVSPSTISPLIFPIIMMLDSFFDANTTTVTTALGHYSGSTALQQRTTTFSDPFARLSLSLASLVHLHHALISAATLLHASESSSFSLTFPLVHSRRSHQSHADFTSSHDERWGRRKGAVRTTGRSSDREPRPPSTNGSDGGDDAEIPSTHWYSPPPRKHGYDSHLTLIGPQRSHNRATSTPFVHG